MKVCLRLTGASEQLATRLVARAAQQWPGVMSDSGTPCQVAVDGLGGDAAWFAVAVQLGKLLAGGEPVKRPQSAGLSRRELFGIFAFIGDAPGPAVTDNGVDAVCDIVGQFAPAHQDIVIAYSCAPVVLPWVASIVVPDIGMVRARWLTEAANSGAAAVVVCCPDGQCTGLPQARQTVSTVAAVEYGTPVAMADGPISVGVLNEARAARLPDEVVLCRRCGAPVCPRAMLEKVANLLGREADDLCPTCKSSPLIGPG